MQLYVDRYLCDKMVPGNRVTVTGIYSIKKIAGVKSQVCHRIRKLGNVCLQ